MAWLKCPLCSDIYEHDPDYKGPVDENGVGVSEYFCLNCWTMYFELPHKWPEEEVDEDDEQVGLPPERQRDVRAPTSEPERPAGASDEPSRGLRSEQPVVRDGATDDGDGDDGGSADDSGRGSDHEPDDEWYANVRHHRFDNPIDD
jgi:hypothetical protein